MNANVRFSNALHILTLLAGMPEQPLTSEFIAGSVNTNPVVIRRLLGVLRKKGYVTSTPGTGGGWRLTADPKKITLLDIRRTLEESSPFALQPQPNPDCEVGRGIQDALIAVYADAEQAMESRLARVSVQKLLDMVLKK